MSGNYWVREFTSMSEHDCLHNPIFWKWARANDREKNDKREYNLIEIC